VKRRLRGALPPASPPKPSSGPSAAELVAAARAARDRAYAPYSGFRVGAALLTEQGDVVTAANVENASYGLAICAERSAVVAAVAAGSRSFTALAVAGNGPDPVTPCGACRQVLREFPNGADLEVLCAGESGDKLLTTTLGALLPDSFGPDNLGGPGAASRDPRSDQS
jgi:cytidine deaminase